MCVFLLTVVGGRDKKKIMHLAFACLTAVKGAAKDLAEALVLLIAVPRFYRCTVLNNMEDIFYLNVFFNL